MANTIASIWKRTTDSGKRFEMEMAIAEKHARRREEKEAKILSVAASLFWTKGFLGTSIDEIAKLTQMNKASIYYYFESKTNLLYEVVTRPLHQMIETAVPIVEDDVSPTEKLQRLVSTHITFQLTRPGMVGIGHIERKNLPTDLARKYVEMRDRYESFFRKVIQDGIETGEFFFKSPKLATLFSMGLLTSITQWYRPRGECSVEEVASMASEYVLKAIGCLK